MKPLKVRICTSKRCRGADAEALLDSVKRAARDLEGCVKIKDVGCLGRCGKTKRGSPPFVEVGDDLLDAATPETVMDATHKALKRRA